MIGTLQALAFALCGAGVVLAVLGATAHDSAVQARILDRAAPARHVRWHDSGRDADAMVGGFVLIVFGLAALIVAGVLGNR